MAERGREGARGVLTSSRGTAPGINLQALRPEPLQQKHDNS